MILPPNSRVNRYEILSKLGAGGMGEVYLALDTRLDRKVALKILPVDVAANKDRMRRFVQEAQAASALNHPNIITIHEIDETDSCHFIATEFIEGETLRGRMQTTRMQIDEVLDVAIQIANALSAAHAAGIIHRDVKPENVMRRRDGIVKVLDFGLVKLTERLPSGAVDSEAATRTVINTEAGVVMGTALYMSPEQASGHALDARTDIFSLGVLIYEMVAGRLPFDGSNTNEVLASILSDKVPLPLARYMREAPTELERIVGKALRKNRDERYQTIKDLALDLRSLKEKLEFERKLGRSIDPTSRDTSDTQERAGTIPEEWAHATSGERGPAATFIKKRSAILVLAALLIVAITAGTYFYRTMARAGAVKSIAVLPFTNVNADADTEYLSDGITDNIIDRLTWLPDLKVIAHSAVFHYKGRDDYRVIGRELGVEAVLTGKVVKRNDALIINLELMDTRDNSRIWGKNYDNKLSDLLAVQREIPIDVSENLRLRLSAESRERLARTHTGNTEAYQLYLKGLYSWEKWTPDGAKQALDFFDEAIMKDPNYALAYSGLATVYLNFGKGAGLEMPQREAHRRARDAAKKALSLDSQLGEAHAALSQVLLYDDWDFSGAEKELQQAIALSPSYAEGHHLYSHLLLMLGRVEESLEKSRKFLELDPVSEPPIGHLGYHYHYAQQYDEAIKQLRKALHLYPEAAEHAQLGEAYYEKGMFREAVEEYLLGLKQDGFAPDQIDALRKAFDRSGIKGYLQERIEQSKGRGPLAEWIIARLYARLGEKDKAFEWLERAYAVRSAGLVRLNEELAFVPLRSDKRFADLVRKVGLP